MAYSSECSVPSTYGAPCKPVVGGIAAVGIHGASPAVPIGVLPESSSFNTVFTYDKEKNVGYWTTDITLGIGNLTTAGETLAESLSGARGVDIDLVLSNGFMVEVDNCFIQTSTFTHGAKIADGSTGVIVLQSITKSAPVVTEPVS